MRFYRVDEKICMDTDSREEADLFEETIRREREDAAGNAVAHVLDILRSAGKSDAAVTVEAALAA